MPPIDDQLSLGACSADAIVAAIEYKTPFVGSRLFVYYNERLLNKSIAEDAGSTLETGMQAVSTYGVCEERLYPYNISHFTDTPSAEAYANGLLHRATKYVKVDRDMNALKNILAQGTPVIAAIHIYSSFERSEEKIKLPSATEESLGGHAVLICGYDHRGWILRNSWGVGWGAKGYSYLPYVYLLDSSFCTECWAITEVSNAA
jgi:C1A family cysteine protease